MRKVFITGASRGIGQETARKFLEEGYEVTTPAHRELDLSDKESVRRYLEQHKEDTFDVIINNAGINDINLVENITDDELKRMIQVNLVSPMMILRTFVPAMKEKLYGRIVNIGSIWAAVSKPGRCVYSATKHGIHGVTNTLAIELAPYHILVNTVCPGFTLTELTKKNNTEEQIQAIEQEIPMGRMADPAEIAEMIYFVASEQNTYMTGQKIMVDGGYAEK